MKTKILLILLYLATLTGYVLAQNSILNYSAIVRNAEGSPVIDQELTLDFSITNEDGSQSIFSESHSTRTNEFGLVNLSFGEGENQVGDLVQAPLLEKPLLNIVLEMLGDRKEFDPTPITTAVVSKVTRSIDPNAVVTASRMEITPPDITTFAKVEATSDPNTGATSLKVFSNNENGFCTHLECSNTSAGTTVYGKLGEVGSLVGSEAAGMLFQLVKPGVSTLQAPGIFQNSHREQGSTESIVSSQILRNTAGAGVVQTNDATGKTNVSLSSLSGGTGGGLFIYGSDAASFKGGLYTNDQDQSILVADLVSMVSPSPGRSNEQVIYSALTGGEAASYERGTAQLVAGEATVHFPSHFKWVSDPSSMTITITPLSAESLGIAVIEKTKSGFKVKELHRGQGTYGFDYQVTCKRKGFEEYQVIQPAVRAVDIEKKQLNPVDFSFKSH